MKNNEHLSIYGVGPIYGGAIILLTVLGIVLSAVEILPVIRYQFLKIPLTILGAVFIVLWIIFWGLAVFRSKIDKGIETNILVTDGVYAVVRNPIYSAFMMGCTGALLICGNLCLLILPVLFWIFLTVLIKNTEEKWLSELYGKGYEEYCKMVNQCIPWFPRNMENKWGGK